MCSNFDPELINRLKSKIDENDWQTLQSSLEEEKQLNSLRQQLLDQLEQNQHQMDNEWQNINVREKSKLVANIQNILYDLQLVEHASKKPLLAITKIIFSANPARCIQRESSPSKSKPSKRRKNELCGLISSSSDEINNANGAKRPTTNREAKLFGISHQMQQQEEERMVELDDPGPSTSTSSNNFGPPRRGGRTKKKTAKGPNPNNKNSLQQLFSPSPTQIGGEKNEDFSVEVMEEIDDQMNLMMMKSPSPPIFDCPAASMMEFNIGTNSKSAEEHSSQQMAPQSSPPQQGHGNGTKTRKRGREIGTVDAAGIAGGRSPRKRGTERQRNHSESNGQGDDDFEEEKRMANSKNKDKDEPTYCFCKQVSFGNMVGCDNKNCALEWFHFACVGLTSSPKGKWYCPECRDTNSKDVKK